MKRLKKYSIPITVVILLIISGACSTHRKLSSIVDSSMSASMSLSREESNIPELQQLTFEKDTLTVHDESGKEVLIMKAIKDDETGEMVANDFIDAAVVTARFRNVAERQGKVDLQFKITVPQNLQDSKWQLRFYPDMFVLGDSTRLDSVIITGNAYRKSQLRGYQQYQRFLQKMMNDSTKFTNMKQLEIFLKRNIPEIYKFKNDTSYVTDEVFASKFGVDEQEAFEHYNRRDSKRRKMYQKMSKVAIVTEGVRLDTVMQSLDGEFVYNYTQTINTQPKLRKAEIVLSGAIFEGGKKIYTMPSSEALTFYISSISAFNDPSPRYLKKVIERRAESNSSCIIDFEVGKADIIPDLNENSSEISKIKKTLGDLMESNVYDLDSIIVNAAASPEGSYDANRALAQRRSVAVSSYFQSFLKHYQDSVRNELGIVVNMDETYSGRAKMPEIKFSPRSTPENWDDLTRLINSDQVLSEKQKDSYNKILKKQNDPDRREAEIRKTDYYSYVKDNLYPKLRTVKFNFYLHRQGMVKDTIHTSVLDTTYMVGVQALKDMDYRLALDILRPYQDFNTAIVYTALNLNSSAMDILDKMPRTAQVNYMLAILYSRMGDERKAVEHYIRSCQQEQSYVYRGNLDPEISVLIKTYGLNKDEDEELY